MTTIAYKDGVLAADSLCTSGGLIEGHVSKVRKIGGLLVAGAGSSALCERFFDWLQAGAKGNSPWFGNEEGNSLAVLPGGGAMIWGTRGCWAVTAPFYAMGSGERLAIGAMAAGKSAREAVAIACEHDVYSGGPIQAVWF